MCVVSETSISSNTILHDGKTVAKTILILKARKGDRNTDYFQKWKQWSVHNESHFLFCFEIIFDILFFSADVLFFDRNLLKKKKPSIILTFLTDIDLRKRERKKVCVCVCVCEKLVCLALQNTCPYDTYQPFLKHEPKSNRQIRLSKHFFMKKRFFFSNIWQPTVKNKLNST